MTSRFRYLLLCVLLALSACMLPAAVWADGDEDVAEVAEEVEVEVEAAEEASVASVTAVVSSDETTVRITASGGAFDEATKVYFPTWSSTGGQDDIVWYKATQTSDGSWYADVDVSDHGSSGTYHVHAYATVDGTQSFVTNTTFSITVPSATVEVTDSGAGYYTVTVSDIVAPSGVTRVYVPTWTSAGGQDDIVWHVASLQSDGSYTYTVKTVQHGGEDGTYLSHVYVYCANGTHGFVGSVSHAMAASVSSVTATVSSDETTVRITAKGGAFEKATKVYFPTWSSTGGQDDIVWYKAAQASDGSWYADVDVSDHGSSGTYHVHAYATVGGTQSFVTNTTFSITAPSATVEVTDSGAGYYTVTVSGITAPSGVSKVYVPSWSTSDGQDDIVWHVATKNSDGTWTATVRSSAHGYEYGTFLSHVYIYCANGTHGIVGSATVEMEETVAVVTATLSDDETTVHITGSGGYFETAAKVYFPTWSKTNGQDDIKWYSATQDSDGSWYVDISVSTHATSGLYYVHAYTYDDSGTGTLTGSATFTVSAPTATSATYVDNGDGSFTVTVSGISSASGISKVQVPTWTTVDGQDDIVWYTASKVSSGTYSATIEAGAHDFSEGPYAAHVYVTGANGVRALVGSTTCYVELVDYIYVTGTSGSGYRTVWVKNPSGDPSTVQVPTWSAEDGQDDIVWYTASDQGDGLWKATIYCKNLDHDGTVYSHVYADGTLIGGISYTIPEGEVYIGWQNPSSYPQVSCYDVSLPDYCTGKFAYVSSSTIDYDATYNEVINAFITRAIDYIGTDYIWDYALAPGVGVDCAGLVLQCCYAVGMGFDFMNPWDHYYTSGHDQYANYMWTSGIFQHVSYSEIKRGDLVSWSGHVAIYIGSGKIIEAANASTGVRLTTITSTSGIRGALRVFVTEE